VPGASSTQVDDMGYKREGAEKTEGEQWAWPATPPVEKNKRLGGGVSGKNEKTHVVYCSFGWQHPQKTGVEGGGVERWGWFPRRYCVAIEKRCRYR